MPSQPPDFKPGIDLFDLRPLLKALRDWAVRKHVIAGPGLVAVESPSGTVLSVDGAAGGGASYAIATDGINAGSAATVALVSPTGASRGNATATNGWSSAIDPGSKILVVRDVGGAWIVAAVQCAA